MDTLFVMSFLEGSKSMSLDSQLHVSFLSRVLLPWYQAASFSLDIENVCKKTAPFTLGKGELTMFGTSRNIPVVECVDSKSEAANFHRKLLATLDSREFALEQPEFAGDKFLPHMSLYPGAYAQIPDQILISDVVVASHHGGMGGAIEILGHYRLTGSSE